jgi:LysR family transcriptional regulator, transcriptional activator of the cysJI operon
MELWQLRTFSVVAKMRHFTRASEELNLSQPAVSHQIKLLEEEIGEPLFLRDKDGIILTKAGQTMYQHATKILDIADEMRLEVKDNEDILSGKIVLGVATRGLGNPLAVFVEDFKKSYKDIDLVIQNEYIMEDIVEKVKNGKIDIGMVSYNLDLSGLVTMPYGDFELLLVVGKNHHLAEKKEITADNLQNQDWITFEMENKVRASIREYANKAGIVPKSVYETNDGSLIRTILANGNKISILPEWGVFEEIRDGRLVALKIQDFQCKIQVNLIWKASRRTKTISAVLNYLLQQKPEGLRLINSENRS